jgi:cobyrinic acid a,c-diamide synthase
MTAASKNMALLDSIFSGERSITALLADTFAGNATVIVPGEQGVYDPDTDTYEQANATDFPVKFIQETMKRNVLTHVGGVQIEAGDLVGVIPAHHIKNSLRRRVDQFRRNGINYIIESTEEISSGDEVALVRILCKRR